MNIFLDVIRNHYADFTGRARRREYWIYTLVYSVIMLVLSLPFLASLPTIMAAQNDGATPEMSPLLMLSVILMSLFGLATFVPSLALTVRRLHDTGRSGWWYLISFIPYVGGLVLLIFMLLDSQAGANKWGPNPKTGAALSPSQVSQNNW